MKISTVVKKLHRAETAAIAGAVLLVAVMADTFIFKENKTAIKEDVCVDNAVLADSSETDEKETETAVIENDIINRDFGSIQAAKVIDVTSLAAQNETETQVTAPAWVIPCSNEDYNNLIRIVESEATGGDIKSKILVADVVINRVKSPEYPDTITGVIFQGSGEQFQPVQDGRFYSVCITQDSIEAVERALAGEDYSAGAEFFASIAASTAGGWHANHLTRLFEYGGHVYFVK